jgi:autotransporter-associated beta strand protein
MLWLAGLAPASAAIIYSGLRDLAIPTNFDGIYLNIQTGVTSGAEFAGWHINPFFGGVGVANSPDFQPARTGTGNVDPIVRYNVGDNLGGSLLYSTDYGGSDSHLGAGSNQFGIGQEGYLAFRLITNGGLSTYYGWMRVVFTANTGGALIKDWAYDDSGGSLVAGRVQQAPPSAGVQQTTFSPATGESFTYGSLLVDPGGGNIGSLQKSGGGTTSLTGNHTFTGQTVVNGGTLGLGAGGQLSGTSQITINAGGTLLFSGAGGSNNRVNDGASVVLAGGTVSGAGLLSALDEQMGALTLSQTSTIDLGLLGAGNTIRFANSSGASWTASQTLRIYNYTSGVDRIFVGTDSTGLTAGQLNAIEFYSDNGLTLLNMGFAPQFVGSGELSPTPVPEPSGLLLAVAMGGLAGWREGRRRRAMERGARAAVRLSTRRPHTPFPSNQPHPNPTPPPPNPHHENHPHQNHHQEVPPSRPAGPRGCGWSQRIPRHVTCRGQHGAYHHLLPREYRAGALLPALPLLHRGRLCRAVPDEQSVICDLHSTSTTHPTTP